MCERLENRILLAGTAHDETVVNQLRHELVIVDAAIPNYGRLLQDLVQNADPTRRVDVRVIESGADGIEAVGEILAQARDLDAVHIVSHGSAGKLQLGDMLLTEEDLDQYADAIRSWGSALAQHADILLYGCDVAASDSGQWLLASLSELTGADVAASIDVTGSPARGGDWHLEHTIGQIDTPVAFSPQVERAWDGQLLIAQLYFIPLPEDQIKASLAKLYPSTGSTTDSTISIVPAQNNVVIYYDQWEDGYEANPGLPTQTTTQVWGDNNAANGIPPGFATDVLTANSVIVLRNNISVPRNAATVLYDGRDKLVATGALAVNRAAWATTPGPVLSGAIEVVSWGNWGTDYVIPVGQNAPNGAFNQLFEYTSLEVMASQDGTNVTIDKDADGTADLSTVLNQGESYQVNGGVLTGARVSASAPVQAHLIVGDVGTTYESDWFTLYPRQAWSSSYYNPVGTTSSADPAATYLYNPNGTAITVNYETLAGSGSLNVPAADDPASHGVVRFQMPANSGARFFTTGSPAPAFFALGAVDTDTSGSGDNIRDWGFTLVPDTYLTPALKVGWAPGAGDNPISGNGSPVWVMATGATRIYADYDGDSATGPLTDPDGRHYDAHFDVTPLQSIRIYDPDRDQSGMRIHTVDGTKITGAWGEDPTASQPGNPYLDVGYTVLPLPVYYVTKEASVVIGDGDNYADAGETIEYAIIIRNDGVVPLSGIRVTDPLSAHTAYVPGSTTIGDEDGVPPPTSLPDDSLPATDYPLDATGYTITDLNVGESKRIAFRVTVANPLPPGVTEIANVAVADSTDGPLTATVIVPVQPTAPPTCGTVLFTNSSFVPVAAYQENAPAYLQVADADANINSGIAETLTVLVTNSATSDRETVTLTESGANTGVFRGSLPASNSSGQAVEDGTVTAPAGQTLDVTYDDASCGTTSTDTAAVTLPVAVKPLYLDADAADNDTTGDLDRVDPAATGDASLAATAALSNIGTIAVAATTSSRPDHLPELGPLHDGQDRLGVACELLLQARFQQQTGQLGQPFDHQHAGHHRPARKVVVEKILAERHVLDRLGREAHLPIRNPVDEKETHFAQTRLSREILPWVSRAIKTAREKKNKKEFEAWMREALQVDNLQRVAPFRLVATEANRSFRLRWISEGSTPFQCFGGTSRSHDKTLMSAVSFVVPLTVLISTA